VVRAAPVGPAVTVALRVPVVVLMVLKEGPRVRRALSAWPLMVVPAVPALPVVPALMPRV
jgi:hypothetical protein